MLNTGRGEASRGLRALTPARRSREPRPLLIFLALAAGCAPRGPSLPPVEPGAEGGRAVSRALADLPCPRDLAADLEMRIAGRDRAGVLLAGSLRACWPDRIRLQARAGAFVPVLSLAVSGESAFVSLPRDGAYWSGVPRSLLVEGSPVLLAKDLLSLLCPSALFAGLEEPILERNPKGWTLRGRLAPATRYATLEARLSRDRKDVREILFRDGQGRVRLRAWRMGGHALDGARLPKLVRIQSPGIGGREGSILFEARLLRPRGDPRQPPDLFRIAAGPRTRILTEEDLLEMLPAGVAPL